MGSWGGNISRRADRMPSLRTQDNTNRQPSPYTQDDAIKDAMMNDLGTIRIKELPLDDTPNIRAIPPRPRRPPAIIEQSEALNGYRTMAKEGIHDAEAMAVRDLDDLGGPSIYRPTAGPTNFVAEARRPTPNLQGMQTSQNGILLPPGAVIHRFTHDKGGPEKSSAVLDNPVVMSGPQPGSPSAALASKQRLPPHLRTKKKTETPLSNKPGPENGTSVEATKPVATDVSALSQARDMTVFLPIPVAPKELRMNQGVDNESKKNLFSVAHTNTVKHDTTSEKNGPEEEVVIYWTGSCKTWIPEQGKECMVMVDLKIINTAVSTEGQSLFVMTLPEIFVKSHSMRFYLLEILKSNLCAVKFVNPDTGVEEGRYRLRFQDAATATDFQHRAALLQKVMGYLSDVAAANNEMEVEASSAHKQNAAQEKPRQIDLSVTAAPVKDSTEIAKNKSEKQAEIRENKPPAKAEDNEQTPNKSKDSTDVITDAFNNLSLNKIKDADMYRANRQRVKYSAEELLERRSSARAPPGITDVKIPLNRQDKHPTNTPLIQDVLERDPQSMKPHTIHDGAKVKEWIAGKQPQSKTEGSSQISMPGLSEAIQCQKAATVTAESLAQASKELLWENKPDNVIVDKNETKANEKPKENDKGSANDGTQMAATTIGTGPIKSKSEDAGAGIDPKTSVDQITTAVKATVSAESKKPDDGAADFDASSDSAVGFQPSLTDQRPCTTAIDQNGGKKTVKTVTSFDMEVSVPTSAVVADDRDGSVKEAPAMLAEASGQTIPMVSPTATSATSFAVHPNILCGIQGQSDQGTASVMPLPHLISPQTSSPLVAQPHVTYTPQMHAQAIISGLQQYPPAGVVHAVSITYHISHSGQSNGQPLNDGQGHVHTIHHVTDLNGQQTGRQFSPGAPVFQPQPQIQAPQPSTGQNRVRRGLGGSIFATGYSGAKHAGSFTGAPAE